VGTGREAKETATMKKCAAACWLVERDDVALVLAGTLHAR
jgi:hypothetical protein